MLVRYQASSVVDQRLFYTPSTPCLGQAFGTYGKPRETTLRIYPEAAEESACVQESEATHLG